MNSTNNLSETDRNKHIEDVIDVRKQNGEYNIAFNAAKSVNLQNYTCRYAYSTPRGTLEERFIVPDESAMWNIEGDLNSDRDSNVINIEQTDSEITVVRVKRESSHLKGKENKWDMHDKAIPGDGTHLGESPSLVNLVTLVKSSKQCLNANTEYLVPLSSWDPLDRSREILDVDSIESKTSHSSEDDEDARVDTKEAQGTIEVIKSPNTNSEKRHLKLAARLAMFFRKYCRRSKNPTACNKM